MMKLSSCSSVPSLSPYYHPSYSPSSKLSFTPKTKSTLSANFVINAENVNNYYKKNNFNSALLMNKRQKEGKNRFTLFSTVNHLQNKMVKDSCFQLTYQNFDDYLSLELEENDIRDAFDIKDGKSPKASSKKKFSSKKGNSKSKNSKTVLEPLKLKTGSRNGSKHMLLDSKDTTEYVHQELNKKFGIKDTLILPQISPKASSQQEPTYFTKLLSPTNKTQIKRSSTNAFLNHREFLSPLLEEEFAPPKTASGNPRERVATIKNSSNDLQNLINKCSQVIEKDSDTSEIMKSETAKVKRKFILLEGKVERTMKMNKLLSKMV